MGRLRGLASYIIFQYVSDLARDSLLINGNPFLQLIWALSFLANSHSLFLSYYVDRYETGYCIPLFVT